jgi:hypothetical protein
VLVVVPVPSPFDAGETLAFFKRGGELFHAASSSAA